MALIRVLMLAALLLPVACSKVPDSEDGGGKFDSLALFDPVPINPADGAVIPFPFNGLFAGFKDPTLNIPNPSSAPFVTAANLTDGFSTTGSIFLDVLGVLDFATLSNGLIVFEADASPRVLVPGVDYAVQASPAISQASGSSPAVFLPISRQRSRILIEPLKPLAPSTTYLVALTTSVENLQGGHAVPSRTFEVVRRDTPVSQQDDPYLDLFNDTQKATLEALRAGVIRPAVAGIIAATGLAEEDLALAWSFTTQSVGKSLANINDTPFAVPRAITATATGFNTNQINPALANTADVYTGTLSVPYFLANSGGNVNSLAPLGTRWDADPAAPDVAATFLGQVPCGAFATAATLPDGQTAEPSVSTTICYPRPALRTNETIQMMVTVPNTNSPSGGTPPPDGWPVVIFQHGITGNRTQVLALAPTLASAGFVTVAIDLPLHGLVPAGSTATCGALANNSFYAAGAERTFDLDVVSNTTGAPAPTGDSTTDCSGTHFINLTSLINSRDNLRQAVSDLIHLAKSLDALNLDGDAMTDDIDETRIHFVGHSLGGIVGGTLLGVNSDVKAATLAMPGGGVAKLLDASATFGPRIAAGLAGSGVLEGSDTYETFVRFAQHLTDPGDPINFAAAARAGHPIHLIEVIGDTVVPNAAFTTCPPLLPSIVAGTNADATAALLAACPGSATQDETVIGGFLSGTDPLYTQMGLTVVGPLSVPIAAQAPVMGASVGAAVQFANGNHGSILDPSGSMTNAAVTCEMQRQTASFLASGGTQLPIGGNCP